MIRNCVQGRLGWLVLFFSLPLGLAGQDLDRARATIGTLTSPGFHGRGYVNGGDRIAAQFLEGQFREMGLKAFDSTYVQPFPLDINTFPGRVSLKIDRKTLVPGQDYLVNPVSQRGRGRGRVVVLDTLIFTQEAARQRFLKGDFRRNVMVYESRHYANLTELSPEYLNKMHEARALIELHPAKLTMSLSPAQVSHPAFEMVKKDLPAGAKNAAYRVDAKLVKGYQSQNVVGYVPGKKYPDEFIVISAHYDHLGRMGKDTYFPGANDNASGTTLMLELARHYARPENQPDYSVAFMAFGAEEVGLIGSRYYTEHPLFPLGDIKFMINLDLLGTGEEGMMVVNGTRLPEAFDRLTQINAEKNYLPKLQKRDNAPNSDHYFFTRRGVKAVFIYLMGGPKFYHDVYDRAETLPLTKFRESFELIRDFVAAGEWE